MNHYEEILFKNALSGGYLKDIKFYETNPMNKEAIEKRDSVENNQLAKEK